MLEVVQAEYRDGYRLWLKFSDGAAGEVDLADALWGKAFELLRDTEFFSRFQVNRDRGTVVWPNDVDLAPEFLHERLEKASAPRKVAETAAGYGGGERH